MNEIVWVGKLSEHSRFYYRGNFEGGTVCVFFRESPKGYWGWWFRFAGWRPLGAYHVAEAAKQAAEEWLAKPTD